MTQHYVTISCKILYNHHPETPTTFDEEGSPEEFFVDSFMIGGLELSEFLTDDMENKLYEILKGQHNEP